MCPNLTPTTDPDRPCFPLLRLVFFCTSRLPYARTLLFVTVASETTCCTLAKPLSFSLRFPIPTFVSPPSQTSKPTPSPTSHPSYLTKHAFSYSAAGHLALTTNNPSPSPSFRFSVIDSGPRSTSTRLDFAYNTRRRQNNSRAPSTIIVSTIIPARPANSARPTDLHDDRATRRLPPLPLSTDVLSRPSNSSATQPLTIHCLSLAFGPWSSDHLPSTKD